MWHCSYQLSKLRMLEFYYNFLDKYLNWCDFELIQMDTDSTYMAISGTSIDDIVRPELREEYNHGGKAQFMPISKYHDRMPGLFEAEFQGIRMIALMSKCYHADITGLWPNAEDDKSCSKFSCNCKGISKKQNLMSWA